MKNPKPSVAADLAPTLADVQAAGFPMGGESLSIDLADTIVMLTDPPTDLLNDRAASDRFWNAHRASLPAGWAMPTLGETRRIRNAIRTLLDNVERGTVLDASALETINAVSAAGPTSDHIAMRDGRPEFRERWHVADKTDLALVAAARSAIALLSDPDARGNLRRCASEACSMLFVKGDGRRRWCTPNICSNRDRVARHYRRSRGC